MLCIAKIFRYCIRCSGYYAGYLQMAGVDSWTNKHENSVFKLFVKITFLENFRLYSNPHIFQWIQPNLYQHFSHVCSICHTISYWPHIFYTQGVLFSTYIILMQV